MAEPLQQLWPWQHVTWQAVLQQHREGRLAHAYLLHGEVGVGKLDFAVALAQWLLCLQPAGDKPCGHCHGCELNRAGSHPDLIQVMPEESGRAIRIDRIRHVIDVAGKTAQQGGYRVIIISPAEKMNINAANALLKVLEEPGDKTVLLLVSEQSGDMLPTIRSRCQQLLFKPPAPAAVTAWLQEACPELEPERCQLLVDMARGRPLLARSYLENGAEAERQQLVSVLGAITKGKMSPVEAAIKLGELSLDAILEWLLGWVHEMILFQSAADESLIRQADIRPMLKYIAGKATLRPLMEYHDWLLQQRTLWLEHGSLNKQLLLDELLIKWLHLTLR